jgi:hypothetical protein
MRYTVWHTQQQQQPSGRSERFPLECGRSGRLERFPLEYITLEYIPLECHCDTLTEYGEPIIFQSCLVVVRLVGPDVFL